MDFSLKAVFGMDATGLKTELKTLRRELGNFVGDYAKLGAGVAVAAFAALSKGAMDLAGNLADTSANIGINVVSLQALEAQHGRNGVSSEALTNALAKTKVAVLDAAQGNERARTALNALGLSAERMIALPLERQYEEIARASAKAKDEAKAYSAVCELLGEKVGPKMFGSLKELGEVGLPGVTKAAREAGHVMESETIVALDRASDAIDDFKKRATVAVGNILINFNSVEGVKLLGMQLMKALGEFGGGILDAIIEGGQMIGAVFKGAFIGTVNVWRDSMLDSLQFLGGLINKILPERFEVNVGNLEQFKSAGASIGEEITLAISQTTPSGFRKAISDSWDESIAKQRKIVDAINARDFGEDAVKIETAGARVAKKLDESAQKLEAGITTAAEKLRDVVRELGVAIGRKGIEYEQQSTTALEGVRARLRGQKDAMERDTSFASVFSPNAKNPMLYGIQSELAAVERELKLRREVENFASKFGELETRYKFGDTITNRVLQDITDETTRTAAATESIERQLSRLFGR